MTSSMEQMTKDFRMSNFNPPLPSKQTNDALRLLNAILRLQTSARAQAWLTYKLFFPWMAQMREVSMTREASRAHCFAEQALARKDGLVFL